jgi:hypothetical protein
MLLIQREAARVACGSLGAINTEEHPGDARSTAKNKTGRVIMPLLP